VPDGLTLPAGGAQVRVQVYFDGDGVPHLPIYAAARPRWRTPRSMRREPSALNRRASMARRCCRRRQSQ